MRKFLGVFLSMTMAVALAACGSTSTGAGCQYSPTRRHER